MTNQSTLPDDEISISDIFLKLWRRRGLILIVSILSGGLGIAGVLLMATQTKTQIIHYVSLTGIEKNQYPNGVKFSPRDLKAPEVLTALATEFNFDYSKKLEETVSVSYAAPTTAGILKKYDSLLAQKGLKAAEIDNINVAMNEELTRASENTAQISIDYHSLGLNEAQATEIALALPKVWAEVFTTQYRVLDNTLLSGLVHSENLSLASPGQVIKLTSYVESMLHGLQILERDSRLSSLQTSEGVTASDLRARVENFYDLMLSAVLNQTIGSGSGGALATMYERDLMLKVESLDEQIAGMDRVIQSLQSLIGGETISAATGPENFAERVQVAGDAIDDIVSLVNKSSLSSYITGLYEKKIDLIAQRAKLNLHVKKMKTAVNIDTEFVKDTEAQLINHNKAYAELIIRARTMNKENVKTLSQPLGSPHRTGSLIAQRSFLIILLSVIAGGFVGVFMALLLPNRSSERNALIDAAK